MLTPTVATSTGREAYLEEELTQDDSISYTRRTPFVPLDDPLVLSAREATYLLDDEIVLGVDWAGEAHAYPLRMIRFHHIVNDTVGGRPLLITF